MKIFLPVLASTLICVVVQAQTFTLDPSPTLYISNVPIGSLNIYDIYQVNTSSENLVMAWEKVSVDIPASWDYSWCDYGTCYPGIPANGTMVLEVEPGGSSFLGLNLVPDSEGSGSVQMNVWDVANPDYKLPCTWIFSTGVVGMEELFLPSLSVYPSPANDFINIQVSSDKTCHAEIFDIGGRSIEAFEMSNSITHHELNSLVPGIYVLRVQNSVGVQTGRFEVR